MKLSKHTILFSAVIGLISVGAHAGTLKVPKEFPTIQEAVDAAVDGDTVLVSKGTYNPFSITSQTNITVAGKKGAVIFADAFPGIRLDRADGFQLKGLTVRSASTAIKVMDTWGGHIFRCRLEDSDVGVSVENVEGGPSSKIKVQLNRFKGLTTGIEISDSTGCELQANRITDCSSEAVKLTNAQFTILKRNRIQDCDGAGIRMDAGSDNHIRFNRIRRVVEEAISLTGAGERVFINKNRLDECGSTDEYEYEYEYKYDSRGTLVVESEMKDVLIRTNRIRKARGNAIEVLGRDIFVYRNKIAGSAGSGLLVEETASQVEVSKNAFKKNEYGVMVWGNYNRFHDNRSTKSRTTGFLQGEACVGNDVFDNKFDS